MKTGKRLKTENGKWKTPACAAPSAPKAGRRQTGKNRRRRCGLCEAITSEAEGEVEVASLAKQSEARSNLRHEAITSLAKQSPRNEAN